MLLVFQTGSANTSCAYLTKPWRQLMGLLLVGNAGPVQFFADR